MTFMELVAEYWQQQSLSEIFAVLLAIAYVWLAAEESVWCWPAGFVSTALYAYIYWEVTLLFQMVLNIYYMGIAVAGVIFWRKKGDDKLLISRMTWPQHSMVIGGGTVICLGVYFIATQFVDYDLVLLDICITVFSLITTYLTLIKKLESWYYWSFINLVSIVLLYDRALYPTMILMFFYIVLAARGLTHWYRVYRESEQYEY
jgi:nicotinamide mononucleotide transporter